MAIQVNNNGYFSELWAVNKEGERVYPCIQGKRGTAERGFSITLTGDKADYHLVNFERLIQHIADGDFDRVGRVRMKPMSGGAANGFAVRSATMSDALSAEIAKRRAR